MPKEDVFYGQVAEEVAQGRIDRTLWTTAFAHSEGDENKAKALYLRYRARQLLEEAAARPESSLPEGLSFSGTAVRYNETEIPYSQVTSVKFYSSSFSINGIPTTDSHSIQIRSKDATISLKSVRLFKIANKSRRKAFDAIYAFANHYIFPALVQRFAQPIIDQNKTIDFHGISIGPTGLSRQGFFRQKSLPWERYYNCGLWSGQAKIYEKNDSSKKYGTWGFISLERENAILLPLIVNAVFQSCCHRK